jgi:cytochrome c oxidase subunit 2
MFSSVAHAQSTFMPVQGSTFASSIDSLYKFLVYASVISCILVIGGMILFALKYKRKSSEHKSAYISHSAILEFIWSFIPFLIFMFVFAWGWWIYHDMRSMPKNAYEIHVVGQKWNWDFLYKSGKKSSNEIYVPVGEPVKLIMSSRDVIHSFYIPGFRVKQDVVPGRYSALWFEATKAGVYQVLCTEFCGDGHSAMLAKLHALPREEFDAWLENDPYKGMSLTEVGKTVFQQKCTVCHNSTAEKKIGPGLLGVFGATREFSNAASVVADENYIRESILNPNAKVVKDYPAAMTPFQGQLAENELLGLIEFIKSLK